MEGEMTVNLGGKERRIAFTMWAIEENDRLREVIKIPDHRAATGYATTLVYVGLANAERLKLNKIDIEDKDIGFTWKDVNNWIYQLYDTPEGFNIVEKIGECYRNCNAYKSLMKRQEDQSKKNSTLTSSMPLPSESLA